jgi:hypothetical protein
MNSRNNGGVSASRATATGGAWVYTPPQETPRKQGDRGQLPPFFLSSSAVTCKTRKEMHTTVDFSSFFISCLWIGFFVYRSAVSFGFSFSVSGGGGVVGVDGCAAAGGRSVQRRAG